MSHIIAIANQKGGVSKTTTAINLGTALTLRGYKVLLIDMDAQANCSKGLGVILGVDDHGIHTVLSNKALLKDIICPTPVDNLFIAPSHIELSTIEPELYGDVGGFRMLASAMEKMQMDDYEYVIIDTPPSLGMLSVNSITSADSIIIPVEPEPYALDGMNALQRLIDKVRDRLKHPVEILGVLLTRYQQGTKVHSALHEHLKNIWGDKLFKTFIRKNVDVSAATMASLPVVVMMPKSMASLDYIALAEEVVEREASIKPK